MPLIASSLAIMGAVVPAQAEEQTTGQKLELLLSSVSRPDASAFDPGEILELRARMIDLVDGEVMKGLHPTGFIRRAGSSGSTCSEAAQAYRATGRVALGDIDLSGTTLLVVQENGMLSAVDPSMSLASANIRWLTRIGTQGDRIVRADLNGILVQSDGLRAVNEADGTVSMLVGFSDDAHLLATGHEGTLAYIATEPTKIAVYDISTQKVVKWLQIPATAFAAVETGNRLAILMDEGRRLAVIDTDSANVVADHALSSPATALAYSAPADALLVAAGSTVKILYLDALESIRSVELAGKGTEIALSADQRTVFSYDARSGLLNVVDLVREALVQALHFPEGIAGITATQDSLSVLLGARWAVANISTDTLKAGKQPNVTEVALPSAGMTPSQLSKPLIVRAGPLGPTLVAQPGAREVYVLPHEPGMRAPTSSVSIRGGAIRSLAILARAFKEAEDSYHASFSVPRAGRYEAVVSAGLFGATACLPFVAGEPERDAGPSPSLTLRMPRAATISQPVSAEVQLPDKHGAVGAVDLLIMSAVSNFQDYRSASVSTEGVARFSIHFPHSGIFIVSATVLGGQMRAVDQIEIGDP